MPDAHRLRAFAKFVWRRFLEDRCLQTAGALAYTSLFALVPLIAAVLGILTAFPVFAEWREAITDFMFRNFVPAAGDVVRGYFVQFAANAIRTTAIGVLVLLLSAVALMLSIEDAFNRIWRVAGTRPRLARLVMYWTVLTFGPLLLVAALGLSSYAFALPLLDAAEQHYSLKTRLLDLAPFLLQWLMLTAAYALIPHRRVRVRDASIGALLAALLFEAAKHAFAAYVAHGANYEQVYGALAIVPIFVLWIYVSWIDVLLGASLTASLAAFDYRPPGAPRLAAGDELRGLIRVLAHFAEAQRSGAALSSEDLRAREPLLSDGQVQRFLDDLERAGLVRTTAHGAWVLMRDLNSLSVYDLYAASGYRLPTPVPAAPDATDAAALRVLARAQAQLQETLALPLGEIFPPPVRS